MEEEGVLPAMSEKCDPSNVKCADERRKFICGVIEGFYGRPWTTDQRKDLFRKLKKWGMDSYVYAPKDDYKHRAYWRELYTVEEADHLSSLIAAAKEHNVTFYYALSPGLDMTYSSQKETQTLKRKLDQVSQFGCEAFALLFDDIESELSKADKEVYQTFANAQVSVTNEIYTHLGNPKFLFCPTQYCSSRAMPTVHDSEYLNTLGSKLNQDIEIMWTGNKVVSKIITLESIQEISHVLRRPPVIWDNLHANDYDQKRVFLGPYCGRSPELISHLRGVMTNPNCEFHANIIAINSLAYWSQCSLDSKLNSSLSADIKLETENDDGSTTECCVVSKNVYHPRMALKNAIAEWLPEFFIEKEAWGPITKPQPQVTMIPIIPIIPSINTCMSLTTTTTTSTNSKTITLPEVNTTQLQALADVCSTVNSSAMNPITNPVMNSLVLPTKVVTNEDIVNPITSNIASTIELPKKIPISIVSVPIMQAKIIVELTDISEPAKIPIATHDNCDSLETHTESSKTDAAPKQDKSEQIEEDPMNNLEEDVAIEEKLNDAAPNDNVSMLDENNLSPLSAGNEPMECSSSLTSQTSPKEERKVVSEDVVMTETASVNELNNSMQVESSEPSPLSNTDMKEEEDDENHKTISDNGKITAEDLFLLCDLFYLPFEHGSRGSKFLTEFNWLKANASVLLSTEAKKGVDVLKPKPEVAEWLHRAEGFDTLCEDVHSLLRKVAHCANKEICYDLFSYVWDIAGTLTLVNAFVKWLALGRFPQTVYTFTQGTYTWFSKGWKEAFMSGDQEPWVFRGGLTADLQRLMPVDSGNDLFLYKLPDLPTSNYYVMRPYMSTDEAAVGQVCTRAFMQLGDAESETFTALPEELRDLISDSIITPFVTLTPEMCIVAHDSAGSIVGYVAAALDANIFIRNIDMCWVSEMCEKYPKSLLDSSDQFTSSKKLNETLATLISKFHTYEYQCPADVSSGYPAVLTTAVLGDTLVCDHGVGKRLMTVALAILRANGCFGVHVRLNAAKEFAEHLQYYTKLGFVEVYREPDTRHVFLGRRF